MCVFIWVCMNGSALEIRDPVIVSHSKQVLRTKQVIWKSRMLSQSLNHLLSTCVLNSIIQHNTTKQTKTMRKITNVSGHLNMSHFLQLLDIVSSRVGLLSRLFVKNASNIVSIKVQTQPIRSHFTALILPQEISSVNNPPCVNQHKNDYSEAAGSFIECTFLRVHQIFLLFKLQEV